jgi:hypothetical protein
LKKGYNSLIARFAVLHALDFFESYYFCLIAISIFFYIRFFYMTNLPAKSQFTFAEKVRRRVVIVKFIFEFLSMIFYTAFTIIMLQRSWGKSTYMAVILILIGVYMLLFVLIILLSLGRKGHVVRSLKDYKSGLRILRSLATLLQVFLTASVITSATFSLQMNGVFKLIVLIVSVAWALFQIVFQIFRMLKRHNCLERKRKAEAKTYELPEVWANILKK